MYKKNLLLILLPVFLLSCAFKPHRSDISPIQLKDGSTQVRVTFHDDDKLKVGTRVGAYSKLCREKMSIKGIEKTVCGPKLFGEGIVTDIFDGRVGVVEFDSMVEIVDTTEFEVN